MGEQVGRPNDEQGIFRITPQVLRNRFVHAQLFLNRQVISPQAKRYEEYVQSLVSAFEYVRTHPNGRAALLSYTQSISEMGHNEGFSSTALLNDAARITSIWRTIQLAQKPR